MTNIWGFRYLFQKKKNDIFGLENTKKTELKTVVSLTDTKRPKRGWGRGGEGGEFFPSSVLKFQRASKIVSKSRCFQTFIA